MKPITVEQLRRQSAKPKKTRPRLTRREYLDRYLATPPTQARTDEENAKQRALFERHNRAVYSLRLPLAPSIDHYYMAIKLPDRKYASIVKSSEGRAYFEAVEFFWRRHFKGWPPEPLTGRIRLLVEVHMARAGKSDVSNRMKALEDALTNCGAWLDDSQIDDSHPIRGCVISPTGAMDVVIEVIE